MDQRVTQPIAILDIGSNSVRMVVYHAAHRVPLPLYNEKHMCGLGAQLQETGALDVEGKEEARHAIARFKLMLERQRIQTVHILATAAIRDASDGETFRLEIEAMLGAPVHVIDGKREASLAALGVISSFAKPEGLVADLGGGSMELATLSDNRISSLISTPLGVLRAPEGESEIDAMLEKHTKKLGKHKTLYAVGGSFRALAKMHMRQTDYSLELLHNYSLNKRTIQHIYKQLRALPVDRIADLSGIPKRRANSMAYASLLLVKLMEKCGCERVVFSVSGIREGYLYDLLDAKQQAEDPLLSSAADLALFAERHGEYAAEMFDWATPLFIHMPPAWERLRRAACTLSEIAWRIDPNFRGEGLYHRVLQSSLKGISHRERVMLSLALYHRHENKWKQEKGPLALIDERERLWAKAVGLSLRICSELTGGAHGHLGHAKVHWQKDQLALELDAESNPLRSAALEKSLDGLGDTLKALSNLTI